MTQADIQRVQSQSITYEQCVLLKGNQSLKYVTGNILVHYDNIVYVFPSCIIFLGTMNVDSAYDNYKATYFTGCSEGATNDRTRDTWRSYPDSASSGQTGRQSMYSVSLMLLSKFRYTCTSVVDNQFSIAAKVNPSQLLYSEY